MFSMNSSRAKAFDDQMLSPCSSPRKMTSPKSSPQTGDKSQDCRGISSSVTILRPKSPTKCSTEEKGLMEFVERGIKDSFNAGVPCPWEDIIGAFSATFLFRSSSGAFIPDVDMQMYWCNFCCYKSKEKRDIINHSMSHRFKCNYCDQECFTRSDVVKHSIRTHPEYKLTRQALKACMLLRDLLEQDETAILFGGNNESKTDSSLHVEYDQQNTNSNHGSSSGGDLQNAQSSLKVADSFSIFQPSKNDFNENSNDTDITTLPLTITESGSLVEMTQSLAVQSNASVSENNIGSIQPLISSTDETGLQIVNVQSSNFESVPPPPVSHQDAAAEAIQLLDNLNNPVQEPEMSAKPAADVLVISQVDSLQKTTNLAEEKLTDDPSGVQVTSKRKATEVWMDSSAEEDEDADPDYQPEGENKLSKTERLPRSKKKRLDKKMKTEEANNDKKSLDVDNLPVGTLVWRCGYCRYRSLKKKKVEGHVTEKHSPKTMKYTKLILNSSKELVRESEKKSVSSELEIKPSSSPPRIKTDDNDNDDGDDEKKKDKYACMFCNYKSANVQIIRQHMFRLHPSKKFCCIDSFLKQSGKKNFYTFFCCRHKCNFLSVDPEKYIDHVEKCTPLPKSGGDEASKPTGLQQSVTFAQNLQDSDKVDGDRVSSNKDKDSKRDKTKDSAERRDYSCHRCAFSAVGNDMMKNHMLTEHPNLSMIALVKKPDSTLDFYLFCPEENCKYVTQRKHELENHRKQNHTSKSSSNDDDDSKDIKPYANLNIPKDGDPIEKNTLTYMPAYECLYCESSCISTSLMNMKRHVQEIHPNEVIIVRDCVAYKRKRPSRIYVCNSIGCIFNDLDYKEYLTHTIAHQGGILYGCANCNWVAQDQNDFNDHVKRQKGVKHSLVETKVIMKDDGSIIKENV